MTTPVYTPYVVGRNASDSGSFFQQQQEAPTGNELINDQVDPTSPQVSGLSLISNPIVPTANAQDYVKNFDPDLYDLTDSSHLMRLIRAIVGASGIGGLRKQNLIARLATILGDGAFFDMDHFYGAIFGLKRHTYEQMPLNLDGTVVNPYTDLANSDIWDDVISRDARYRSRLFLLARAINMGTTFEGIKAAAEAVTGVEVDITESWVRVDFLNSPNSLITTAGQSYGNITYQSVNYGNISMSYGDLGGSQFGVGQLPQGNRGELIITPREPITYEDQYQLQKTLNVLKPSHVQVTIATNQVVSATVVPPRGFAADSENWQIQSRITPAVNLINPATPIYENTGDYSQARPVFSEYTGERWTYNPNVVRSASYRMEGETQVANEDAETIKYSDGTTHQYGAKDGIRDIRQSIAQRLSGEGVVTNLPYANDRSATN